MKKKRLVEEFENYTGQLYQRNTINLWWWRGKEPMIDIACGNGQGYTIDDFSKTPLQILKVLVKELTKREKIKNKADQRI